MKKKKWTKIIIFPNGGRLYWITSGIGINIIVEWRWKIEDCALNQ